MMASDAFASYPSLRGRTVLITGGASGIGEALVEAFASQGARVVFLDVQTAAAQELVQRLTSAGLEAPVYYECDLAAVEATQGIVERLLREFGPVDVLVNNAGNDTRHSVEEVTPGLWDRVMAVNLRHQFFLAQAVIPGMRAAGRGSIINMSSIAWVIPSTNLPVYVTAKAAIVGLTRTLAHELGGDNIRVNCILPGAIWTERQRRLWLTPEYEAEVMARQALKRHIEPQDVARLALFLGAEDSAVITNQSYVIDAGWV